ncbi:MAG: flagellar biosynthetic protein FliR [Clostridiales bacterium]|nr:flagellar biosynthetic protein FliR [Clostridiales bacterium]
MTFSIVQFEVFFLILVRISGFMFTAPFFSLHNVPRKVKAGLALYMTAILFYSTSYTPPAYTGVIGFSLLVAIETLAGAIMGFFANIAYQILSFAGQMIDMDIGFSMVSQFDPATNLQTTITANFYGYLVLLTMMVTGLYRYFIRAIIDSFKIIELSKVQINTRLYLLMGEFLADYFIIAFRIIIPVFASILVVNTILAILSKMAPQMNMFVIGIQLKVFVGLLILFLIIEMVPSVADFIFKEMSKMLKGAINMLH